MDDEEIQTDPNSEETEGSEDQESGETSGAESTTGSESQSSDNDVKSLEQQLRDTRREAAKYRKERNAARTDLQKRQDTELSDIEREKKRADDAEARLNQSMSKVQEANLRVALADTDTDIVDIDTASLLLRQRGIEFDESGAPVDVQDAISDLVKDKPFLAGKVTARRKPGNTNGGADGEDTGTSGLTADELVVAKSFSMTPSDYAAWKDKSNRPKTTTK